MTTVSCPAPRPAEMPTEDQTTRLLEIVLSAYPALAPQGQLVDEYRENFGRALLYLAYAQRRPQPDAQHAAWFWIDEAGQWLRRNSRPFRLALHPFLAAVICQGIPFTAYDDPPAFTSLGLQIGDRDLPTTQWPEVLRHNAVRPPTELRNWPSRLTQLKSPSSVRPVPDDTGPRW